MVKKILCGVGAIALTVLELLCFKINPLDVFGVLALTFGFTYTLDVFYMDFIEDHKCAPLMWVVYGCMLVCTALAGAAFITNKIAIAIIAGVFAGGAVVCYLIEKQRLKAANK